jgi:hypothetical protein
MERREFIKKAGIVAAGSIVAPYILPSGSLFAKTTAGAAEHVVFVLFAGGVIQQESVLQRYLSDSQGLVGSAYEGNIMFNMLNGGSPSDKIVFGTDPSIGLPGTVPIPKILSSTLQSQGTFFPEVAAQGVGHYTGLNTLLTGVSTITQGLRQKPMYPTIFEYARKYLDLPATKTWFVGNGIGNSIPLLNYSDHPDFGAKYGANFFAPSVTFGAQGETYIRDAKPYHPEEELAPMYKLQGFLNNTFALEQGIIGGVHNTEEEKYLIKLFIKDMFAKKDAGTIAFPSVNDNGDLTTVGYGCEVMKAFTPTLTVINLSAVDGCHSNFTGYLKSLHRADHAVGHIWNYIQTQIPTMSGKTAIIACPEHGRNLMGNSILDQNDWKAYDHSDVNSTRVFSMMAGPSIPSNLSVGSAGTPIGDIRDCVLTVAELLGIKSQIQAAGYIPSGIVSLFDRI